MSGLPYLEPVWHNANWRVWKVVDFQGLVRGPAQLTSMSPDGFTIAAAAPGTVNVRVRASSRWKVLDDSGCATSDRAGWTVLRVYTPGIIEVTQSLRGTPCKDND